MQKNKFVNESIKGSCRNTAKRFIAMGLSIMVPFAGLKGEFCSAQNITKTTTTTTTRPKGDVHEGNFTSAMISQNQNVGNRATNIEEGLRYSINGIVVDGETIIQNRIHIMNSQRKLRRSRRQGNNTNIHNTGNQPENPDIYEVQPGTGNQPGNLEIYEVQPDILYRIGDVRLAGRYLIEMAEYIDREILNNLYRDRDREGDTFQYWLCWGLTLLCSLCVAPFIVMASK